MVGNVSVLEGDEHIGAFSCSHF